MNSRISCGFKLSYQQIALATLAAAILHADTTFTYQNGANSYTGSTDVSINTQYSQYNGGNGIRWTGGSELGCYNITGADGYLVRYLLKFGGLTIPGGSKVVSATLTLSLDYWNEGGGNLTGYYLKNAWNPASNNLGWLHRDDKTDWAAPGAGSAGVDTVAGSSFRVPPLQPVGVQAVNIPLDIAVVQSWIDNPALNQGIMLVNNANDDVVRPVATTGTKRSRPILTIVIAGGSPSVSVSISPATATVQSGKTQQFTATVTGSSNTAVTWTATGGAVSSSGLYTAGSTAGSFTVTATSAADATKSATASVTIASGTSGLPPVPRQNDGPYVVIQSPASGMHFFAPATIRIYADPFDINAADPDTMTVTYLLNGQAVGTFTGTDDQNGTYPFTVNNLSAGTYVITGQITAGGKIVSSAPVTVFVDNLPTTSGPVFNLTGNVTLSGSQAMTYTGTAGNPCLLNGNGFQITSTSSFTGSLNISNCIVRNLGSATTPSIDVAVNGSGSIQLSNNIFEMFGTVSVAAFNQAQIVVRGNEFRENTLVPVTHLPIEYGGETLPVFQATGNSAAQQYFQGNNVGLSTVLFQNTQNWLIGGNSDADSNVMIGVRCGFTVNGSSNMVLRGNYSQHNYPHRMSQGNNFQLDGDNFLVEHNIIRSSSWPVRGMGGELRYNLIDASGNSDEIIGGPMSNVNIHHNLITFTVSQTFYSPGQGLLLLYNVDGVQFHHNTMDGGGTFMDFPGSPVAVTSGAFIASLRNNVFYNFASSGGPMIAGAQGESTTPPPARLRYADYNDFFNPDAASQTNYGLSVVGLTAGSAGYGLHDLGGVNGHVNPKLTNPTVLPFPFRPEDIWSRALKVSDVLSTYRSMYTPASGSPLLGAGDPQDGPGGNIGAIGNGESADQFGKFGSGSSTPAAPVILGFTASPAIISPGGSATLNWSVSGATALSIAPAIGTVTGTSISVTPSATSAYTLTATNAAGSVSSTVTVIVSTAPAVAVTISPASTSVAAGGTAQFTATVTGAANTGVTWTATGGTISSSGLFTAGSTSGSFQIKATSVQDSSKSATASVTVTAQASISVAVSPTSTTLVTGGTQQFGVTVAGTSNTSVTWTATGGTISSGGIFTAGSTPGVFQVTATSNQDSTKSGTAAVTIVAAGTSTDHPRIFLDAPTLATLRSRVAANTPQWKALKATCDSLVGGTVFPPGGNEYPDLPNVGEGYQGSSYMDALMPVGLCYNILKPTDPTSAAKYGAKGIAILQAMSDPSAQNPGGVSIYVRDDGYGIRFYGTMMAIGYDWFHDLLTPALQAQLQNTLTTWINTFETSDQIAFEYDQPIGNYYCGYYAAKAYAALAVQGDAPIGDTWWNDWYSRVHNQVVAPFYSLNLANGGWPEGFGNYGPLSILNMSMPALAVRTAKGIDLIHSSTQPYSFPLDNARYLMHFTWPSRTLIDDRDSEQSRGDDLWPGTPNTGIYSFLAGYLAMWNDPLAPALHKYAREAKAALMAEGVGPNDTWAEFFFWDDAAPEADYTTTTPSYLAAGTGEVSARTDWSTGATWMSFRGGPYVNNPGAGHQSFDPGTIALVRGNSPLLVNVEGWLAHQPNGDPGENDIYDDNYGNGTSPSDHSHGNRKLYNTFQTRHVNAAGTILDNFGTESRERSDGARTGISRYEDGGSYVMALSLHLEDMYRGFQTICSKSSSAVSSLSRQVIYLRPSQFVVYDRSTVCDASLDQYLAFHFPASPLEVTAPAAGLHRFDVSNGAFAGSMTTVLPANAAVTTTDNVANDTQVLGKVWRSEIRPTDASAATRLWLTVFDLSTNSTQVAAATPLTVISGPVTGAVLASPSGNNVTVFGTAAAGTAITGTIAYSVPAASTHHLITDLTPQGNYSVSVSMMGNNHVVTVTSGGSLHASDNGVLSFTVNAAGSLQ